MRTGVEKVISIESYCYAMISLREQIVSAHRLQYNVSAAKLLAYTEQKGKHFLAYAGMLLPKRLTIT
jgi:hypothetical protein